jgi:hypothetical protein
MLKHKGTLIDILADDYRSETKRAGSFSYWLKTVSGIARRLVSFLHITDEDQEKAGIYLDYER